MQRLREGRENTLGSFAVEIRSEYFLENSFRMNSARTATFVNTLAQFSPKSFISSNSVNLDAVLQNYNKAEFHHIFPKSYMEKIQATGPGGVNSLANFYFLSRADNNKIRAQAPFQYKKLMPKDENELREILVVS